MDDTVVVPTGGLAATEIPTLIEPVDTARIKAEVASMTRTMGARPPVSHPESWPPAAAVFTHDTGVDPRTAAWFVEMGRSLSTVEPCSVVEYDKLRAKKGEKYDAASAAADGHIEAAAKVLAGFSADLSSLTTDYFPANWMDQVDEPGWIDKLLATPLPEPASVETVDVGIADSPTEPVESAA